jgi:hypothetical protein
MDSQPLTRKESKKSAKDKKQSIYSTKHIRIVQGLKQSRSK